MRAGVFHRHVVRMPDYLPHTLVAAWLLASLPANADTSHVSELATVVVTAASVDGSTFTVPHGMTVITASDIADSAATSLSDLLSRQAGLHLKSTSGNDKNASIDIRGMGDTAVSNVLVLVDGVRLNEADLSGANLSSIALADIDRIEILRGGGAVRYGDGAVGGVINIVTRTPQTDRIRGGIQMETASYDTHALRASISGGLGDWRVRASTGRALSDGYRQNNTFNRTDGNAELRYAPSGLSIPLETYVRLSVHEDTYGLPGPVTAAAFAGSESQRRASQSPFDGGETDDRTLTVGALFDFGASGVLEWLTSWRDRDNLYVIGYSPLLSYQEQASRIESNRQETQLRYNLDFDALGHTHSLGLGMHWQSADYSRRESIGSTFSPLKTGELEGNGAYIEATFRGTAGLSLTAGARANELESDYRDGAFSESCAVFFPVKSGCTMVYTQSAQTLNTWRNHAYELGLAWQVTPTRLVFASASRHFRAPNVDELALATTNLQPQRGTTAELGLRSQPHAGTDYALTLFGMRIEDEIYFGPDSTGGGFTLNRNYDQPTRRLGGEFQARWQLTPSLGLRTNLAYVRPRFEGTDADVPHVPRLTANARLEWRASDSLRWFASARHVGKRYDGNDLDNQTWPVLPAYTVYDLAARYSIGNAELTAAVNNLFDKVYSTTGYSGTYYPMPGRNFALSLRWTF